MLCPSQDALSYGSKIVEAMKMTKRRAMFQYGTVKEPTVRYIHRRLCGTLN